MNDLLSLTLVGLFLLPLLLWCFRHLPREHWQMLAVIPHRHHGGHRCQGTNLTYYGFFIATSQLLALALLIILLDAIHASPLGVLAATAMLLAICLPAARVVAMLVEKKRHTFTIGGACFIGTICAPLVIATAQRLPGLGGADGLPILPVLAAMAIAYVLGEGLGRLACISYGCCYGKPLRQCGPLTRRLFAKCAFIFSSPLHKAVYESGLQQQRLVPIQAVTCLLSTLTALVGCGLFLERHFCAALILAMGVSQLWRLFSETLRADFRGFGSISAYQKMGILSFLYTIVLTLVLPQATVPAQPLLVEGLKGLWNPGVILGLQLSWLLFFLYFGRSTVTTARVDFELARERI